MLKVIRSGIYMNKRFRLVGMFAFLNFAASCILYAQSAQVIDQMLKTQSLTCADACYLAGIMAGKVQDDTPQVDALEMFRNIKGIEKAKPDDLIRYDVFAALIMDAGEVKASIWYNLYRTPHYAFRYIKMEGLVGEATPPSSNVNPRDALAIISKLSEVK